MLVVVLCAEWCVCLWGHLMSSFCCDGLRWVELWCVTRMLIFPSSSKHAVICFDMICWISCQWWTLHCFFEDLSFVCVCICIRVYLCRVCSCIWLSWHIHIDDSFLSYLSYHELFVWYPSPALLYTFLIFFHPSQCSFFCFFFCFFCFCFVLFCRGSICAMIIFDKA